MGVGECGELGVLRAFQGRTAPATGSGVTRRGPGLSGWEPVGTESWPRESRRGKTPGHLGWGKVQIIHAGGKGLALRGPEVSDGKLRPQGTGSLAGKGLGEGTSHREKLDDASLSRWGL